MARRRTTTVESGDLKIGQDQTFQMPATGPVDREDFADSFEIVDGPKGMSKAAALAFDQEIVEVVVSPTTDKNAERYPCVYVRGIAQYFERGKRMAVRRKYVEGLARAKKTAVYTVSAKDQDGADTMNIVQDTGLKYPFAVVNDPNPNGRAWLEKVLAEG